MSPKSIAAITFLAARGFHSAVRGALEADRERWILWIPAAFGCGIALYFTYFLEEDSSFVFIAETIALVAFGISWFTEGFDIEYELR